MSEGINKPPGYCGENHKLPMKALFFSKISDKQSSMWTKTLCFSRSYLNHHSSGFELNDISVLDMSNRVQWRDYMKCEGTSDIKFVYMVQEELSSSRVRVIESDKRDKFL